MIDDLLDKLEEDGEQSGVIKSQTTIVIHPLDINSKAEVLKKDSKD